jgi:hypothetical protein
MRTGTPRCAALAVALFPTGGLTTSTNAGAQTRAARTVTVTPSTGLVQGQSVHVSATGFTPHRPLFVVECKSKRDGKASRYCDETSVRGANPDDSGAFSLDYTVNATLIGVLVKGLVNCTRSDGLCSILVLDPSDVSVRASAPISFSETDVKSRFDTDELTAIEQVATTLGVNVDDVPRIGSWALAYVLELAHTGPITPPPGPGLHSITTHWPASEYTAMAAIAAAHGTTVAQFQKAGALFLADELGFS